MSIKSDVMKKGKKIAKKVLVRGRYFSRFELRFPRLMLRPEKEKLLFDAVNIDINNTCNLRCRFCFNTFDTKHIYMTKDIFERILPIFSLTKNASRGGGSGVYLSCLYEPSLSPEFLTFLGMLPEEGRRKVFFTSNFCRPWKSEQLAQMLEANLHHINISVETFNAERYEIITSSKHFDSFYQNIHCLAKLYQEKKGYRPKLRYITMVLKLNLDEIPELVRYCRQKLHSSQHELRTPYISVYDNMEWNRSQMMNAQECQAVRSALEAIKAPKIMDIRPLDELVVESETLENTVCMEPVREEQVQELEQEQVTEWVPRSLQEDLAYYMHQEYFFLRFHPDGTCTENVTKNTCPIPERNQAEQFYQEKLIGLHQKRCVAFLCESDLNRVQTKKVRMKVMIEKLVLNACDLTVQGWCSTEQAWTEHTMLMVRLNTRDKDKQSLCYTYAIPRPDLKKRGQAVGFTFCVERERLSAVTDLVFLLVDGQRGMEEGYYEYPYGIHVF